MYISFLFQALAGHLLCRPVRRAIHDIRYFCHVPQSLPPLPRQRTRGLQGALAEDRQLVCPPRVPVGVASHRPAHNPASCHAGEEGVGRKSTEVLVGGHSSSNGGRNPSAIKQSQVLISAVFFI